MTALLTTCDEIRALLSEGALDAEAMQIIRNAAPALLAAAEQNERMKALLRQAQAVLVFGWVYEDIKEELGK